MLKNTLFIRIVCGVSIYSFILASIPQNAKAWGLPPESFNRMYAMAHAGEVEGLRASVSRGLNIDSVNSNGYTGLCVAAERGDIRAYNAFRAAGANPRHPCTQYIDNYNAFVRNSNAVSLTASPREAYSALGKEQYKVAPWVWWTGGALLVGGVAAAIALGGGGGGGGGHSQSTPEAQEEYNSLGAVAAQNGKVQNIANQSTATNSKYVVYDGNANPTIISGINLNNSVLSNTNYMDVLFKAQNGGAYINDANGKIETKDGVIAMDALKNAHVTNNGYIKVQGNNAAIGMVASETSTAVNNGVAPDYGIYMYYSGTAASNTIIGMYADTNSVITNSGNISGTATSGSGTTSTALVGSMIGMEAMTINDGQNRNAELVRVVNAGSGNIQLSAGSGTSGSTDEVSIEMVGMGNYLNYGFLHNSKQIDRAEKVDLINNGNILLNYVGHYTSNTLRQGRGGVIGMRAELNGVATNNNNILIQLDDTSSTLTDTVDVAAGMLLVHGGMKNSSGTQISGILNNSGNITIETTGSNSPVNYGILSVEGSGKVSSLYQHSLAQPVLNNTTAGTINVVASNSYGMATYNSGILTNAGLIVLGSSLEGTTYKNNIAMYAAGTQTPLAQLINTGRIDIYSYLSVAMQNDFSGATEIVNDGIINVYDNARSTRIFSGAYSGVTNKKTINYNAQPYYENNPESGDYSGTTIPAEGDDKFVNYTPTIGIAVLDASADGVSSTTEHIYNGTNDVESAVINVTDASFVAGMQVDRAQGSGYNHGLITLKNKTDSGILSDDGSMTNAIGMYLTANANRKSEIINYGSIYTDSKYSAAMAGVGTEDAFMQNAAGALLEATHNYSIGMYINGQITAQNAGAINMKFSDVAQSAEYMTAIYAGADTTTNTKISNETTGVINVGASGQPINGGYGIFTASGSAANVTNNGAINIYTKNNGGGIWVLGTSQAENKGNINVFTDSTYGMYAGADTTAVTKLINSGTINVGQENEVDGEGNVTKDNSVANSYGIYSEGAATITNAAEGVINLYNDATAERGYAIYSTGEATIENSGTINLANANSAAIYTGGGSINNKATLNILNDNSYGLEAGDGATATNSGTINLGTSTKPVSKSYGLVADAEASGKLVNGGIINVYSSGNSYAISAKGTVDVDNSGNIEVKNSLDGIGINNSGSGKVSNSGTITMGEVGDTVSGNYGIYATNGTIENSGTITMNVAGSAIRGSSDVTSIVNAADGTIIVNPNSGYGLNAGSGIEVQNYGTITLNGLADVAINASNNTTVTNAGTINIGANETTSVKNSYGIKTSGYIEIVNDTESYINVYGDDSFGIYALNRANSITNKGNINVYGDGSYGIYAVNPETITNEGDINVSGDNSFGIWVDVTSDDENMPVKIENKQTINVSGNNSYAIYVQKDYPQGTKEVTEGETTKTVYDSDNTTVTAGGAAPVVIKTNGGTTDWHEPGTEVSTQNAPQSMMSFVAMAPNVKSNVRLINSGVISTDRAVDFGDGSTEQGQNVLAAGGQYVAESFSGTVHIDASNVKEGFAQTYVNEDAFVGADDGIEVVSDSYMFNAATEQNDSGNTNVVMSLNSFDSLVDNNSTASFLTTNYAVGQGANLFQNLKIAATQAQFDAALNRSLGLNVMPNFIKQNLDTERTLNAEINDDIVATSEEKTRARFKVMYFNNKTDGQHQLSGYDYKTTAVYGFADMQLTDLYSRTGLGLAVVRSYGKFDDVSKRYNNMAEVFAPFSYQRADTVAMFKPKGGIARGHYRRLGADKRYKGDNRDYYYGADTLVKHVFDTGVAEITPSVGVNVTGMYVDSVHESNGGLKIKSKNIVSTQSVLGLDIAKTFALSDEQNLHLSTGSKYYHEFGQKYHTKATVDDMIGGYDIADERMVRDFGDLSLKATYQYKQMTIGAEVHAPIEHNRNPYYLFNVGYRF